VSLAGVVAEYSEIARMFEQHEGPTNLYLNFDCYQAKNVLPFVVTNADKDPTTDDREIAIHAGTGGTTSGDTSAGGNTGSAR
jgi:hypothetical protein